MHLQFNVDGSASYIDNRPDGDLTHVKPQQRPESPIFDAFSGTRSEGGHPVDLLPEADMISQVLADKDATTLRPAVDGTGMVLDAGSGDNTIIVTQEGDELTIQVGEETFTMSADQPLRINGGDGADYIQIDESVTGNVTVDGGAGDDLVFNAASGTVIGGGEGDDALVNLGGEGVTLLGGTGNDQVFSQGNGAQIDTFEGDDYVYAQGDELVANTGDGADSAFVYGDNNGVATGEGDDRIDVVGDGAVVTAGGGNDTVELEGDDFWVEAGLLGDGENISVVGTGSLIVNLPEEEIPAKDAEPLT